MTTPPKPPPGWYPDPSGARQQRYWNGDKWTDIPPPPLAPPSPVRSSKSPVKTLVIIGATVFALVGGCAACSALIDHLSSTQPSSTTSSSTPTTHYASPVEAPPARMGEEVRDGKLAFVVTDVKTRPSANDHVAQGVYLVVSMTVRNTGNRAWSFSGSDQKLKDSAGREYEASLIQHGSEFKDGDDINPGNQITVDVLFDVPPDTNTAATVIILHDSMFSHGVKVSLAQ